MVKLSVACALVLLMVKCVCGRASPSLRGPQSLSRQLKDSDKPTPACSAYPGCAALGLTGDCCPSLSGRDLGCCNEMPDKNAAPNVQSTGDLEAGTESGASLSAPSNRAAALPAMWHPDDSWWKTEQPESADETGCLLDHKFGCNVIAHQLTCLGSKDGRDTETLEGLKIKGQPCVWCGGGPCHDHSTSLCEPLDFLMNGQGRAFTTFHAKANYQAASCKDGTPMPPEKIFRRPPLPVVPTIAPWWLPSRPSMETMSCLAPLTSGCFSAKTMGQCLHGKDGSSQRSLHGLKVAGEPCVWCGGGACTSNSSATCAPFDYALRGEGTAFSLFFAKSSFKVASCINRDVKLPEADFACLVEVEKGCHTLSDAASCLSSRDGRDQVHKDGFKVQGQPCVWCGGGPCTSSSWSLCEPFDWALNGEGQAFDVFHPKHVYRLAGCKNNRPAALSLQDYADAVVGYVYNPLHARPLVPFWVAKKPTAEELACLKPAEGGCNRLRNMASCMSSKDGRALASFKGMKIADEPCVWCGGIPCTTNSTSLCEPFDYLMYGEGVAFSDFSAKGVYRVPTCDKGDVAMPSYDYSCLEMSGSDGCAGIWNAEECLASKDGRSVTAIGILQVQNQPCVWCGGGPCHSGRTSLCEAFDYAVNGEGRAFAHFHAEGNYRLAACKNGKPKAATLSNFTDYIPGYTSKPLPMPTVPPRQQWWVPPRPTEANISCLSYQVLGCSAIKDMGTCLSSRDGRTVAATADGLKIHAEPCVWCGGGPCHSNSSSYCEPFDYLMRGEGRAFSLFYAPLQFSVANCKAGIPLPDFDFSCLSTESKGCGALTTADACLQSKDGRQELTINGLKVHAQPCVWCGGVPCHSSSLSVCEPFDYVMNGEGKAFTTFNAKLSYSFAGCKDKRPAAMTYDGFAPYVQGLLPPTLNTPVQLVPFWVPEHPKQEDMTCLAKAMSGCQAITEMNVCLSSRDDSGLQTMKGLKVHGEPCVWCPGSACTSNSSAQCQPFDFVMHGEGLAFTSFLGKGTFRVANCYAPIEKPKYEYTCLKDAPVGCSALTDPYDCLASKDGRPQLRISGLRVSQEPCVWCGGGLCHSGATTMCEPFDYVMNGAGRAFYNFHAKLTYRMAACQDGHRQGATIDGFKTFIPGALPTMKPYWWITEPKPEGDELSCLMDHKFGCYVIRSKGTCLGSKDGRDQKEWNGLKIHGEPCVWCGGFPCQSNSTNLCEPYDFLMHGQGKAFLNFNAKTSYNVARCKNNLPVQPANPESVGQGANSNSASAVAAGAAVGSTTAARAAETDGTVWSEAGVQKAPSPDSSIAGKDCWYECGEQSGYCDWCGVGKACCRDGWSANSNDCTGAIGYTTDSNHECVAVPASSDMAEGGIDLSESTTGPAGASVLATDSPSMSAVAPATRAPAQNPSFPSSLAPASKDITSLAPNTAYSPVNTLAPSIVGPGAMSLATPVSTSPAGSLATSATETTAAPGMLPPLLTLPPTSTAAPATATPVGSLAASAAETAAAPGTPPPLPTLPPASTAAPTLAASATETTAVPGTPPLLLTLPPASTAAPATAAPVGSLAASAAETTAAPGTPPPLPTLPPASTAAPATVAPVGSLTASATETTVAPGMFLPLLTEAPASTAASATLAPLGGTAAPAAETTVALATLPPLFTSAPASTVAPGTMTMAGGIAASPTVTVALASTAAFATVAPVGSTAIPASESNASLAMIAPIIPAVSALSIAAPNTEEPGESTEAPAASADQDCWYKCGEKAGNCPTFCGEGKVCCRSGVLSSPPECSGLSLAAFSTIMHHQCVKKPADSIAGASATHVPGVLLSTSQPEVGVRTSTPTGPHRADAGSGVKITYRDTTQNSTNTTLAVDDISGAGIPMCAWLFLAILLLLVIPVVDFVLRAESGKKGWKKVRMSKRSVSLLSEASNEDSFDSSTSELELQTPLVEAQARSVSDNQSDLFDHIDQNHDGIISQAEWNHAMGVPAQAVPVAMAGMSHPAAPMTINIQQAASPLMTVQPSRVSMRSDPNAVMMPGAMSVTRAPAGSLLLGAPGAGTVRPYTSNNQYAPVGAHPI